MMRPLSLSAFLVLLVPACQPEEPAAQTRSTLPVKAEDIDRAVKALGKELKEELLAALDAGSPAEAIGVCRDKAPAITASHSERTGWTIRRTALRLRNQDNAPDDWERRQLRLFAEKMASGTDPASLTTFEIVDGQARFARAIPTGAECLLCHGPSVAEDTKAALARLYPEDAATQFSLGDLRGIFSATVPRP